MAIHNEADVVPESVDAVRAVMNACSAKESIARTDKALKQMGRKFSQRFVRRKGKEIVCEC